MYNLRWITRRFKIFSLSTIKRIVKSLVNRKVISVENFNGMKMNNTNWYAIDYEKLFSLINSKNGGIYQWTGRKR